MPKNNSHSPKISPEEKRNFRLVVFRLLCRYLGIALVISAVLGGLYRDRLHFIYGLCAAGAVLIAMGWWEYLRLTDSLPFRGRKKDKKASVPYLLRKEKEKKRYKPAFLQKAEDFEDDLTPSTTADMEVLDTQKRAYALIISRIGSGVVLFILSFIIPQ